MSSDSFESLPPLANLTQQTLYQTLWILAVPKRKIRLISQNRRICGRLPGNEPRRYIWSEHSVMSRTIFSSRSSEFERFCLRVTSKEIAVKRLNCLLGLVLLTQFQPSTTTKLPWLSGEIERLSSKHCSHNCCPCSRTCLLLVCLHMVRLALCVPSDFNQKLVRLEHFLKK